MSYDFIYIKKDRFIKPKSCHHIELGPTDVSKRDTVKIGNYTADIVSVDEKYSIKCEEYKERTAIVAKVKEDLGYGVSLVTKFFYDKKLGFLLGMQMYYEGGSGKIDITLTETNIKAGISPLVLGIIIGAVVAVVIIVVVVLKLVMKKG